MTMAFPSHLLAYQISVLFNLENADVKKSIPHFNNIPKYRINRWEGLHSVTSAFFTVISTQCMQLTDISTYVHQVSATLMLLCLSLAYLSEITKQINLKTRPHNIDSKKKPYSIPNLKILLRVGSKETHLSLLGAEKRLLLKTLLKTRVCYSLTTLLVFKAWLVFGTSTPQVVNLISRRICDPHDSKMTLMIIGSMDYRQ